MHISSSAFVPLILALLMMFFRRFKSLRVSLPEGPPPDLKVLRKKYAKWTLLAGLLFLPSWALTGGAVFLLLKFAAYVTYRPVSDALHLAVTPDGFWALLAIFLGMVLGVFPADRLLRRLLGAERHAEYELYDNLSHGGIDGWKVFRVLAVVICLVASVGIVIGIGNYAYATQSEFVFTVLGFGEHRYSWSEVKEVRLVKSFKAPNENIVSRPYHEIEFADGKVWSVHSSLNDLDWPREQAMFAYVCAQSGKTLTVVDPYP